MPSSLERLRRTFGLVLFAPLALAVIGSYGCVTLPRYKDVEPRYSRTPHRNTLAQPVAIFLEPVFVGKRFDEVVCDNVVGAEINGVGLAIGNYTP